jgi:3-phenylpropionate/cinnamic acid dioxygenase small subunit
VSDVKTPTPNYEDTSRYSYHVDQEWYDELKEFTESFARDWPVADSGTLHEVQAFLTKEARLIDEARFNHWLELFTPDSVYWVPVLPGGPDPDFELSHAFDDFRRLSDRVYWLRTGLAFSQLPASRTRRVISNIEVLPDPDRGLLLVRSNFVVTEFRAGVTKIYSGWYGHVLARTAEGLAIRVKQTNLLDSEQGHENLTLVL